MNPKLRRTIWYVVNAVVWLTLLTLLLTMVGPERFLYQAPASRGKTGMVDKVYIVSPLKDSVTVGKRANVILADAVMDEDFGATLDRQPTGAAAKDSEWVLTAEETSPTPVLLNGQEVSGNPVVQPGDVLTIGGIEVVFDGSRTGIGGALDWWESAKVSHLYASPAVISEAFPIVLKAFPVSLFLVIIAYLLAIPGGLALAFMKMARTRWAKWPATAYVDVIRGTPIFLQILLVFFGLPLMPPYQALMSAFPVLRESGLFNVENSLYLRGFVVLSFNSAAYMAEIFRAGIQSINKGQMEAARSLGMTTPQAMTYVIIPQTIRRILPTMMSEFILLFKDTSLFSAVGLGEIIMRSREVASTTLNVSPYLLAAGFYLVITIPLGRFVQQLENRLAKAEGGGGAASPEKPSTSDSEDEADSDATPQITTTERR